MISHSHWSDIGKMLLKYQEDDFLCDTILVTKDRELKAHGVLLAAVSPVFRSAFEADSSQGMHCLSFPETDSRTLEVVLHFVYTGKLLIPVESSETAELSKLFSSLQDLGLDLQRFNGSEIKFAGDGELHEKCSKIESCEDEKENEVKSKRFVTNDKNEEEKTSIYISVTTTTAAAADDDDDDEVQEKVEEWIELNRDDEVKGEDGKNEMESYETIQKLLLTASQEDDKAVISEHSYYSFKDGSKEKLNAVECFEGLIVKSEAKDDDSDLDELSALSPSHSVDDSAAEEGESEKHEKCQICEKSFRDHDKLERHMTMHSREIERPYECQTCQRKFPTEFNLIRHMSLQHKGSKLYLCHLCGRGFIQKWLLRQHMELQHGTQLIYGCSECETSFNTRNKLQVHLAVSHKIIHVDDGELKDEVNLEIEEPRSYLCDICGKNFKTSWSLKTHEQLHTGMRPLKPYSCPLCNRSFIHKSQVGQHMIKHTGLKPYTCSFCNKSYSQKGSLTQHLRTHTGEKPFVCQVCGKAFIIKAMLQQHVRVHTGEKPHICLTCGKGFIYKESLIVHVRIHTGEKPFVCKICGNCYTQSHHLKGHMLTHTGEKPFTCDFCEKAYKNRVDLRFHCLRVHQVNISKRQTILPEVALVAIETKE